MRNSNAHMINVRIIVTVIVLLLIFCLEVSFFIVHSPDSQITPDSIFIDKHMKHLLHPLALANLHAKKESFLSAGFFLRRNMFWFYSRC